MKREILLIAILLLPTFIFAATNTAVVTTGLGKVLSTISDLFDLVKNLIFALAFIAFFYGLLKFIFAEGEDKEKGKSVMIWGIIALFVMFSIWGLISILQTTFSNDNDAIGIPPTPDINGIIDGHAATS